MSGLHAAAVAASELPPTSPWLRALAQVQASDHTCPHGHRVTVRCGPCEQAARDLVHGQALVAAIERMTDVLERIEHLLP